MLPIRIIDRQFNLINEIDQYSSLQITCSFHGIGIMELRVNRHLRGATDLLRGRIIFPKGYTNKAYVIRHREIELDENGKITENWIIRALPLKSWFGQRATLPPSTTAYDNKQGNAETVMKHYVNNNVVNPEDINRRMSDIVIAENLNRGQQVSWQSRYKNLAEELSEISLVSGLGWNVSVDVTNKKFVFDVLEGRDLTVNQSILSPVIFSPLFDNIKSMSYVDSDLNYKNTAYIAGQGEGVDRRIVKLGTSTGFDRYEIFVDARDVSEETEDETPVARPSQDIINDLINRGQQSLAELSYETFVEAQILTPVKSVNFERKTSFITQFQPIELLKITEDYASSFVYEQDWDLGDIPTVQNKDWGITLDPRIVEVKEIYEPGGFSLEATFGSNRPTLINKIRQELAQFSQEVRR